MDAGVGIHLVRSAEARAGCDALAAATGGRVGLGALLAELRAPGRRGPDLRRARRTLAPGRLVHRAWTWDRHDRRDRRWWPQGVSTSADATDIDGPGLIEGRRVVAVAWYAKALPGDPEGGHGSRVTFLDLDSRRYAHVLLVLPRLEATGPETSGPEEGGLRLEPLRVHAGGIVWTRDHLHVAATARGLMTSRLDDLVRVPVHGGPDGTLGYRWLLPVRSAYRARTDEGTERLRYSFASLDRHADVPALLVGEYGRGRQTTRIVRFPLDPTTGLLVAGDDGRITPLDIDERGVAQAQGIAVAGGTTYGTVSHGPHAAGSLVVGAPGAWREQRRALPMGPEDLTWWPARDELRTATEHPGRRWVVSVRRSRLSK